MATLFTGLITSSEELGIPGVEDLRGVTAGVEEREDLRWRMGEGEGVWGEGERSTTCGEENSNSLAATPAGLGLGV